MSVTDTTELDAAVLDVIRACDAELAAVAEYVARVERWKASPRDVAALHDLEYHHRDGHGRYTHDDGDGRLDVAARDLKDALADAGVRP